MNIDLNHCLGSSIYGEKLKRTLYFSAINLYLGRIALPIVLCTSLITLATKVCTVVEVIIKGFINIIGKLCCRSGCHLTKGLKQLFIALPASLVDLAIGAPFEIVIDLATRSIKLLINPREYAKSRCTSHHRKYIALKFSFNAKGSDLYFYKVFSYEDIKKKLSITKFKYLLFKLKLNRFIFG